MSINPTVVFLGLIVLIIASGVGEAYHLVPAGTASSLIGVLVGSGIYHTAVRTTTTPPTNNSAAPSSTTKDTTGTGGTSNG